MSQVHEVASRYVERAWLEAQAKTKANQGTSFNLKGATQKPYE